MNIKRKYQKVKILAEKGATEGERHAAREAIGRMEEKYPELKPSLPWKAVPYINANMGSSSTDNSTSYTIFVDLRDL